MDALTLQRATGCSPQRAETYFEPLSEGFQEFQITTPQRQAAFLAQVGHESGSFRYVREIWGPTTAQAGYEGRADLGNMERGDGKRYMGRGLIQITGRDNYERAGEALGLDLISHPEMLEDPGMAAISACWWWSAHKCNEIADTGDFEHLTRRINGGLNGLDDRMKHWTLAKQVLGA